MEVRAGYKQTEVGVIPEEWDSMTCADLCVRIQDGTHFSPTIRGHDYLYLTSKNVRFGFLDISTADQIDTAQHESIYKRCDVKHGDLLLTKDGANTGNAALNTLTEQFSLLSSVAFLRFDTKKHSAAYFLQQFLSAQGQQRMKDAMSGNAITRLTLEKIRKLRFPVAPLPEQRTIAVALSDVDALLGGLERLIAKKHDLKQAAMQQLLTGQTRLPGYSGEWGLKELGDLVKFLSGGTPSKSNENFWNGDVPWISATSLRTFYIWRSDNNVTKEAVAIGSKMAPVGSTLLLVRGSALHNEILAGLVTEPVCFNQDVKALVPKSVLFPNFLTLLIRGRADELLRLVSSAGNTAGVLDTKLLKAFRIRLPSLPEQTAIATILSDMDAELSALVARRDKTRDLKQAMMQELLTGRTRLV